MSTHSTEPETLDALVIGAGFSGLYQLYSLREQLGLRVKLLEAGGGVGGTWYWNRYPGARCDSESHVYCYTFSESLTQEWDWSERYPGPTEIVEYLNHVTDRFDLRRSIDFDSRVISAQFNEGDNVWDVKANTGRCYRTRFLITAVGCLSSANIPDIPGIKDFEGDCHHTGQWPNEGVQFEGKRVGQIGTGSTGIQAAPVIAQTAKHLTVFQRTANYSVPARNHRLSSEDRQELKCNAQITRKITRSNSNGHGWLISEKKALEVSEGERKSLYEKAWEVGGLKFRSVFSDLLSDSQANATAAQFIESKIRKIVKNPSTAETLSAIDHPYAAKRPPIDTQYFETYNRENVALVDLIKTPIVRITKDSIVCSETNQTGQRIETTHELDTIVFATGYDAITGSLLRMDIRGRKAQTLRDAWSAGPRNYLGLQVAGFPNMFMITGPGSPSVLSNMPAAIEQHVEWITACIAYMIEKNHTTVESTESSVDSWVNEVNTEANKTLLPQVKHSWYLGANIPGKAQVFMPYAGGLDKYRKICQQVADEHYKGFLFS